MKSLQHFASAETETLTDLTEGVELVQGESVTVIVAALSSFFLFQQHLMSRMMTTKGVSIHGQD